MASYTPYLRDRKDGRTHGGVICYIRDSILVVKEWPEYDVREIETILVTIRPQHMQEQLPISPLE